MVLKSGFHGRNSVEYFRIFWNVVRPKKRFLILYFLWNSTKINLLFFSLLKISLKDLISFNLRIVRCVN
jgi:hypothetical protein